MSLKNKQPGSYKRSSRKDISKLIFLVTKASRSTIVCWWECQSCAMDSSGCSRNCSKHSWAGRGGGSKGGKQMVNRKNNINEAWVPHEARLGGWGTGVCRGGRLVIIRYSEQVWVRVAFEQFWASHSVTRRRGISIRLACAQSPRRACLEYAHIEVYIKWHVSWRFQRSCFSLIMTF